MNGNAALRVLAIYKNYTFNVTDGMNTFLIKYNGRGTDCYLRNDYVNKEMTKVYRPIDVNDPSKISVGDVIIMEILPITETDDGYLQVKLSDNTSHFIHRMVVFTFGDKHGKTSLTNMEIDHVNGNKHRNIPENLERIPAIVNKYRAYENEYSGAKERLERELESMSRLELIDAIINILEYNKKGN